MTLPRVRTVAEHLQVNVGKERQSSLWFKEPNLEVYLRAGLCYFLERPASTQQTVAISSVSVKQEMQGQGVFREFLERVQQQAKELGYHSLRVEQIHNPILKDMLERRGWLVYPHQGDPPTYYIILN